MGEERRSIAPGAFVRHLSAEGPFLDAASAARLRAEAKLAASAGAQALVVDLGRVHRISPLGLSGLAMLSQEIGPGARLALASLGPKVRDAALVARLHEIFDVYADPRTAAEDLSRRARAR
jgi:anti-anti-sigma regulatory factor